eukprot:g10751.t1
MLGFSGSSSTSEVSEDEDGLIPGGGVTDAEYSIFPSANDGIFAKQLFEIYPSAFNTDASHLADVDSSVMKEIVVAVHFRNMILAYKTLLDRDHLHLEKVDDEIAMLLDPPSPASSTERLLVDRFTGLGLGDCGTIGESGEANWRPKNILRREQGQEQGPLRALGSSFYWALQPGYWSGVEQQNIRPPYTQCRAGGVDGQPAGVLTVSGREDILSCANRSSPKAFHGDGGDPMANADDKFYLTVNLRAPDLLVDGLIFQDLKSLIEDCQQLEATQEATSEEITTSGSAEDPESSGEDEGGQEVGQGAGSFCHVQHHKSIFSKTVLQHLSKFLVLEVTEDISIAEVFERFGDPVEEFSFVLSQWKQELLPNVRFSLDDVVDVVGLEAQMITKRGGTGADERPARKGKLEEGAATSSAAPATSSSKMKTFLAKSFNTAEFLVDAETEHRRRQLPLPLISESFNFRSSETPDRKTSRPPPPLFDIVKIDMHMDYAKSLFFAHPSLAAPWKRELVAGNFAAVDMNHLKQCLLKELRGWAVDDLSGAWEVSVSDPGVEEESSSSPSFMLPFFSSWKTKASSTPYLKSCSSSMKSVKLPNMQVLTKVRSQLEWEELAQLAEEDVGTSESRDFRFITVSDYVKLLERFVELVAFTHDNGQDLVIELTLDANDRNIQKAFQMLNEIVLPGMETKEREQNGGAAEVDMPISLKFWTQLETATQQGGASGAIAFRAQEDAITALQGAMWAAACETIPSRRVFGRKLRAEAAKKEGDMEGPPRDNAARAAEAEADAERWGKMDPKAVWKEVNAARGKYAWSTKEPPRLVKPDLQTRRAHLERTCGDNAEGLDLDGVNKALKEKKVTAKPPLGESTGDQKEIADIFTRYFQEKVKKAYADNGVPFRDK